MEKLTKSECEKLLKDLPLWEQVEGKEGISKTYRFKDFNAAFAWMTKIAVVAEKMDHHPEWCNVWNRVDVFLTTHDVGGITQKDILLAKEMEARKDTFKS